MASNQPFKKKKVGYNVDQSTVDKILKKRFGTEKKPKKFTWKGLMDATSILETNPFDPTRLQRIRDLMEGSDAEEKDYIDTFEDLEKAYYSGAQKFGYAIGDLATAGIDLTVGRLFDTNLNEKLTEVYEENKLKEPETLMGKVTELLTQYAVPSSIGFKITNRLRKFSMVQKAKGCHKCRSVKKGKVLKGQCNYHRKDNYKNKKTVLHLVFGIMFSVLGMRYEV